MVTIITKVTIQTMVIECTQSWKQPPVAVGRRIWPRDGIVSSFGCDELRSLAEQSRLAAS